MRSSGAWLLKVGVTSSVQYQEGRGKAYHNQDSEEQPGTLMVQGRRGPAKIKPQEPWFSALLKHDFGILDPEEGLLQAIKLQSMVTYMKLANTNNGLNEDSANILYIMRSSFDSPCSFQTSVTSQFCPSHFYSHFSKATTHNVHYPNSCPSSVLRGLPRPRLH